MPITFRGLLKQFRAENAILDTLYKRFEPYRPHWNAGTLDDDVNVCRLVEDIKTKEAHVIGVLQCFIKMTIKESMEEGDGDY